MTDERSVIYTLDIDVGNAASALDLILGRLKLIETNGVATIKALDSAFSGLNKTMQRTLKADRKAQVKEQQNLTTAIEGTTEATEEQAAATRTAAEVAAAAAAREKRAKADSKKRSQDHAKAIRLQTRESKLLEREQLRLIRSNKELRKRMQAIIATSGTVRVKLGGQKAEMGSVERQIQDLVEEYGDLNKAMQQTRESATFKRTGKTLSTRLSPANLSGGQAASGGGITPFEVRQLAQELDRLGLQGASTAGTLGSIFGPAGIAAAVLALGVIQLTKLFVKLGQVGVKAMTDLLKSATELGKQYELSRKAAEGFFMGNDEAARGALKFAEELGEAFGIKGSDFLKRFIPLSKDLDQFERFAEAAQFLKFLDPSQNFDDIARSLTDASRSGYLTSLKRTFAIPIDGIKDLQGELGNTEGLLIGLEKLAVDYGFSLEDILNTGTIATERLNQQWITFQQKLGEPISVQIGESVTELMDTIGDSEGEIDTIFNAMGQGVAGIVDQLFDLLDNLDAIDSESLREIADAIGAVLLGLEKMVKLFDTLVIPDDLGSGMDSFGDRIAAATRKMLIFFGVAIETFKLMKKLGAVGVIGDTLSGRPELAMIELIRSVASGDMESAISEFTNGLDEIVKSADEYVDGVEAMTAANDEYFDSTKDSGNIDATNDILEYKNALKEVARLAPEIEEMNEEIADAVEGGADSMVQAELQLGEKMEDAALDRQRKMLDLEEDTAEKRIDAARKNADKIEDIFRKHQLSLIDAATGLRDKEADIALKFSRKQEDIELESARNKIKIEEDYRSKLEEIRRKFFFNMEEAIRNNDAVAFLRLQRQLEFELENQKETRDEKLEKDNRAAEEKRIKAAMELEREIQDSAIANERKLRDLQVNLARQLEAQRIAHERELEAIALAEERKREEIEKSFERQIEDIDKWYERRVEAINAGTEKEIAAIRAANERIIAEYDAATARLRAANQRRMAAMSTRGSRTRRGRGRRGGSAEGFDPSRDPLVSVTGDTSVTTDGTDFTNAPPQIRRQFGGPVKRERAYLVGEAGPELFAPNVNGRIIPNNQMMFSPPAGMFGGTTNNFSKRLDANVNMLDPNALSQSQVAKVEAVVSAVLMEALR